MATICIKRKLYPTKAQETLLKDTLTLCREVYNSMVIERTAVCETQGNSLSRNEQNKNFTLWKQRKLVNQYGLIAVEKLNVKGMAKNPCLARSISDASCSQFRSVLTQKAESAVRRTVEVNPAYTSQTCSRCGNVAKKPLKERWHFCLICSLSLDRDANAAFNILQAAVGTHSVNGIPL